MSGFARIPAEPLKSFAMVNGVNSDIIENLLISDAANLIFSSPCLTLLGILLIPCNTR